MNEFKSEEIKYLSHEELIKRSFELAEAFKALYRALPEFNQAVVDKFWREAEGGSSYDPHIKFTWNGQRYSIEIGVNPDGQYVWTKRRNLSPEELSGEKVVYEGSLDYWQEQVRLNAASGGNSGDYQIAYFNVGIESHRDSGMVDANTNTALTSVTAFLEELTKSVQFEKES